MQKSPSVSASFNKISELKNPYPRNCNPYIDRYADIRSVGEQNSKRKDDMKEFQNKTDEYVTKGGKLINASKVVKIKPIPGITKFSLIATQCPLKHTINAFWDLIYTSGQVDGIVALGPVVSGRLDQYWESSYYTDTGCVLDYTLTFSSLRTTSSWSSYKVDITPVVSGPPKTIYLWHYFAWPDRQPPTNLDDFEEFVKLFKEKRKLVVHCSAGIGRTGTFAACLQALKDRPQSPRKIVENMRTHRTGMVQNADQFEVICKFIARNCNKGQKGPGPGWDDIIDYDKYFGEV